MQQNFKGKLELKTVIQLVYGFAFFSSNLHFFFKKLFTLYPLFGKNFPASNYGRVKTTIIWGGALHLNQFLATFAVDVLPRFSYNWWISSDVTLLLEEKVSWGEAPLLIFLVSCMLPTFLGLDMFGVPFEIDQVEKLHC